MENNPLGQDFLSRIASVHRLQSPPPKDYEQKINFSAAEGVQQKDFDEKVTKNVRKVTTK